MIIGTKAMVQMKRSRRVGPCGIGALTAVVLLNYARTGSLYSQRFYSTMHQAYVFGFQWFWRTTCYDQFYSVILPCYFKLCCSIPTNALTCIVRAISIVEVTCFDTLMAIIELRSQSHKVKRFGGWHSVIWVIRLCVGSTSNNDI